MLFFKFIVLASTLESVLSCPAAKKSNLRNDEVQDYHRKLSQIIGVESHRLAAVSQMNAPVCSNPAFTATSRGTPGTAVANANIQSVYQEVRTIFYNLVDAIANGGAQPAATTTISNDPLSLFPITGAVAPANLGALQKAYRVANLLGNALRLVFHDAGEVDIRTTDLFGSDGCLADNGPNSGLKEVNTVAMTLIEPLWQKYCDKISRADFWVMFGKIAAESGLQNGRFNTAFIALGGVVVPTPNPNMPYLNIPYQYGRKDAAGPDCNAGSLRADGVTHRLPGHQPGLSEFSEVYVKQMGLDVRTGVVLSGAHTVGHVHTQFSGFGFNDNLAALEAEPTTNAWDETPWLFDNTYYDSLAGEFWLNNAFQANQIVNQGVNGVNPAVPTNSGANFWAVQIAAGGLQPIPACVAGQVGPPAIPIGSCGAAVIVGAVPPVPNAAALLATNPPGVEVLFCIVAGVTHYATRSLEFDPVNSWSTLSRFANYKDLSNTCNCMQFFAVPPLLDGNILTQRGCTLLPHPKTIMLNADMVQNFPISGTGPVPNLIATNPTAVQNLGVGNIGELCAPFVVNPAGPSVTLPAAAGGRMNTNQAVANGNTVFPQPSLTALGRITTQGFGCVVNSVGNRPNFIGVANTQIVQSSLLPVDPNTPSVSLWATVQSFRALGVGASCIQGISTYNNPLDGTRNPYTGATQAAVSFATNPYGGSVTQPLSTATSFIGQNLLNGATACTDATHLLDEGRDNFYREFEVAWVKMTTVGFTYSKTFNLIRIINGVAAPVTVSYTAPGNGKLGALVDINLLNPNQRRAHITAGATRIGIPNLILPTGITWSSALATATMTGGPLYGSSTCYVTELC